MTASSQQEEKRQYYKSWASYQIPLKPTEPIDFELTEPLKVFYLAHYGKNNRLLRFVQYTNEREDLGEEQLAEERQPNSILYYEAPSVDSEGKKPLHGKEIKYPETEGLASYIKGQVNNSGNAVQLQKVDRIVFFSDEYAYWPNGKLKQRVMTKQDGSVVTSNYDESGNEIK